MAVLERADRLLILLLNLCEGLVPALVEVLVLHQVGLLDLLALSGLLVNKGLPSASEILDLQLLDAVLRHFGLYVLALSLTLLAVLLQNSTKRYYCRIMME